MTRPYHPRQYDRRSLHRKRKHDDEILPESVSAQQAAAQPSLVSLQRQLGNAGVQRLLRSGGIQQVAGADMVHRKGCGCAACAGQIEHIQRAPAQQIQRFWGDDEDDGGSVWDSVTDAAGSAWDSASGAVSDAASSVSDTASSAWGSVSDAAGSAWDSASGAASDVASGVSDAASSAWGAVSGAASSAWDAAGDAASSAWGAVSDAAGSAWGAISEAAGEAGNTFGGLFGDEASSESETEDEEDLPTSGSVDAIKGSKVGMGGGCDLPYGTPHPRFFRPSARQRAAQRKPAAPGRPFKVNANITMVEHTGNEAPVESSFVAYDMPTSFKVGSNLDFGSQTEAGGIGIPGDAFGYSAPTITVDNIKWTLDPSSATIGITARIHVWVNWAIRSNSKTDINSGDEDTINANNWEYVIKDLRPDTGGGQPARGVFYSSTTTVKHELYHAKEYIASAQGQIPAMAAYLAGKTVNLPEDKSSNYPSVIGGQVSTMMGEVRDKVEKAVRDKYNGGGEDRAYGDGKGDYNAIIANIEKRAKAKGWPKNMVTP
ncbi:MAG: hypothetical protein JNL34_02370 [Anaerolineae bacterium]|nr:hypothetical protein [Anaerolineae bacterium]